MEFTVADVFPASPERVYQAWIDSDGHSNMTGGKATVDPSVGGSFTAWGSYICGQNVVLEPGKRIVQSWRTENFSADEPDSQIEVVFEEIDVGCRVTLHHTKLPPHGTRYETGWVSNYFEPMKVYFGG